ncbi:MAG: hypothetical protein LBU87_03400 [Lactobacillales bacterium]|jgi:hypothetical protein|nr:hypothetical protein [Lactobacillales bacterium]
MTKTNPTPAVGQVWERVYENSDTKPYKVFVLGITENSYGMYVHYVSLNCDELELSTDNKSFFLFKEMFKYIGQSAVDISKLFETEQPLPTLEEISKYPGLGSRFLNCMANEGINSIKDLLKHSSRTLFWIPNMGHKTVENVEKSLEKYNLKLKNR